MNASDLLDLRLFTVPMAADLLELGSRLRYWVYGWGDYEPAIRPQRNTDKVMTWGEFMEAAALKELRQTHNYSLQQLRIFRQAVATDYPSLPYPLASVDVLRNGRALAYAIEQAGGRQIYEPGTGQIAEEGEWVETFVEKIELRDRVPVLYRPDSRYRRVVISAERRFGAPNVEGIRTEGLWMLTQAGETVESLAEAWRVDEGLIHEAVEYERERRRQPALA